MERGGGCGSYGLKWRSHGNNEVISRKLKFKRG